MAVNDLYVVVGCVSQLAMLCVMVGIYQKERQTNQDIHETLKKIESHNGSMVEHLETVSQVASSTQER